MPLSLVLRDYVHRVGRTARAGRSGWSLSFVTQHDVQLVHKIEELIGHQLGEFKTEEAEVLKGITKVRTYVQKPGWQHQHPFCSFDKHGSIC